MPTGAGNAKLKAIGDNVRKYRVLRRMSQGQLAFEANTTLKQIQRIEKGSTSAGIQYFLNIAEALEVNICVFFS